MTDEPSVKTPQQWERVKELFQGAVERPATERAAFVATACAGDSALQQEVERLLRSHDEAGSFIEAPAADLLRGTGRDEVPPTGTLGAPPPSPHTPPGIRRGAGVTTFVAEELVAERYRIVRFIAEGGMGEVYEAEDLALHGLVALKTIRPEIAEDGRALERFKREIHIARKVTHPNVCRIYDLGTHHTSSPGAGATSLDVLFLTMELLSGETLSRRIMRSGRMKTEEALPIVSQVAAGLEAAHAAGIIHRDFKSANVVLVPDARTGVRAVITDFGLARTSSTDRSQASISDSGAVAGTPAYMAPEQVQGLPLTTAADIYALGVVIYEMVTGFRPFDGGSAISVAAKRLTEAPQPPRALVPDLDLHWQLVILRCLEREPTARFARAADVAEALRSRRMPLLAGTATAAVLTRPALARRPSRWRKFAIVGLAVAAAGGALAYGLSRLRSKAPTTAPSAASRVPVPIAPRRAVAVLGLENASGRPDAAWLATAIAEMLATDLAAGGTLRVVPGQDAARAKRDLGLKDANSVDKGALEKARRHLGADMIVVGSYTSDGGLLRVELRLLDAAKGTPVVSSTASGTETQLFDLVSRAAKPLRERLGVGEVSPAQALQVEASLPSNPAAAKLYAEGLARLRLADALGARDVLEKAVAAEPKHPLPLAALAAALSTLGYEAAASESAKKAAALSGSLSPEEKLAVEARLFEIEKDWEQAVAGYRTLFEGAPDDVEYGLALAEAQTSGGRAREALVTIEALRRLPAALSDDPRIDLAEARARQDLGDLKQQQALAATAARKAHARGARLLVARARLLEAGALETLGERARAAAAVEEAKAAYEAAGDRGGVALALERMALSLDGRGDKEGAKRLYERALAMNREIGNKGAAARNLSNLGTVHWERGNVAEAQKLYEEALATFRQIGTKYQVASALNDIGARLHTSGDLPGAQQRYQEALAIFSEIGEKSGVATTLTNLAELLFARGELKQAQEMHEESLALYREIGDKSGQAYDLYRLGELFAARGDLRVALGRYAEALKLQKELGDTMAAAQTQLGMAALATAQGRPADGESLAREAEEVFRSGGAADAAALARAVLAESLMAQGKHEEARKMSEAAEKAAGTSQDHHLRLASATTAARIRAASGKPEDAAAALKSLEGTRAEAARAGLVKLQYEAQLAIGEVEMVSGKAAAGRARLAALVKEADARGLGLVARRAEKSLTAGAS